MNTNQSKNEFFGHPKGLSVLFFTEMWERFSYYGMRALLTLYMVNYLLIAIREGKQVIGYDWVIHFFPGLHPGMTPQAEASQLYGIYTGLVYSTPILGGILADRWLGKRRSVYVGSVLMAIGHFLMAIETAFFPAMLFLILGNGFFKPNISTQVGSLYKKGDLRLDRAYALFYIGINVGAFFSPLVCGQLGQKVGWHWGFAAAGVGMLVGLLIYYLGSKHLPPEKTDSTRDSINPKHALEAPVHEVSGVESLNLQPQHDLTVEDYKRLGIFTFLSVLTIAFWGVFEQQGNTLQLFADRNIDWNILGFEVPSTYLQILNPLMIFLFAPLMIRFWEWQSAKGREPNSIIKMALGCFFVAIGFGLLTYGVHFIGLSGKGSVLWLVGCTFFFTIGELYLSPTGLSIVYKISPAKTVSMMMGVWLFSSALGGYFGGTLGKYYEVLGTHQFFLLLTALAGVAALVFAFVSFPLKKWIS